jgi:hypothetical protein
VTAPQVAQAAAAVDWLGQRKEAQKAAGVALREEIVGAQNGRAAHEAEAFEGQVDGYIKENGDLAAGLLADIQAKNDAIQATLEALKHEHYGHQDAHGYRYKLLNQLHHQRVVFEQAVEAAWVTWTQSRDLSSASASEAAPHAAGSLESFLANQLGAWEAHASAVRGDLGGQVAAKGEALKGSVQEAARVFAEKQAYKRNYIASVEDAYKREALAKKVDLEDKIFQDTVKGIWTSFTYEATGLEQWLDSFLDGEGDALAGAQDAIGSALADALADQLDRLGAALGELGDAFFQAKHDESERLMQALYGYGYGDYKADYEPVFKHEEEYVEKPVVYREPVRHEPVYREPEPVYHESVYSEEVEVYYEGQDPYVTNEPVPITYHEPHHGHGHHDDHHGHHEYYSATTGPYYESSEGPLSENTFESPPYASESELRNTEYDNAPVYHAPVHHSVTSYYSSESSYYHAPEPVYHAPVVHHDDHHGDVHYDSDGGEVFYEGEDPYVIRHEPAGIKHHAPEYQQPHHGHGHHDTHYAAAEPDYYSESSYTQSVYESSGYYSSANTSRYGETSYRSPVHRPAK